MSQLDPYSAVTYPPQLSPQAIYGQSFTQNLTQVILANPQDDLLQYPTPLGTYTVYQNNPYDPANHVVVAPPFTPWPVPNFEAMTVLPSAPHAVMTTMVPITPTQMLIGFAPAKCPDPVGTPEPGYALILALAFAFVVIREGFRRRVVRK